MQPEAKVMLVGAGPGAADLLTVRALRAIEGAQVLLYDALVGADILDLAPRRCLRILTGKRSAPVGEAEQQHPTGLVENEKPRGQPPAHGG